MRLRGTNFLDDRENPVHLRVERPENRHLDGAADRPVRRRRNVFAVRDATAKVDDRVVVGALQRRLDGRLPAVRQAPACKP